MQDAQNFGTTAVLWLWTNLPADCVLSLSHRQEAAFLSHRATVTEASL